MHFSDCKRDRQTSSSPLHVVRLLIKVAHQSPLQECQQLRLRRGWGIENDANAQIGSPRQLLLIGLPTLAAFHLKPGDLRENILLSGAIDCFQSGQLLQIGPEAVVRLMFACEPCARLNELQPGLARQIRGQRGILGRVVRSGSIQQGDAVVLRPEQLPPIPDAAGGRLVEFVARISCGKVVSIPQLLLALGLSRSYARAVPALLKKAPANLPIHRIVSANGGLLMQHIPDQQQALLAEGIEVIADRVPPAYHLSPSAFHDLEEWL